MSSLKVDRTEFPCPLCGEIVSLSVDDPQSYLSRTEHEKYFGMQLATYRVAHDAESEKHIVSVLVDQAGYYRGLIDAFAEKKTIASLLKEEDKKQEISWRVLEVDRLNDYHHPLKSIDLFLYLNERDKTVVPLHYNKRINFQELTKMLLEKLEEAKKLYEDDLDHIQLSIADKRVLVGTRDDYILALSVQNDKVELTVKAWMQALLNAKHLLEYLHHHVQPIFIALKVIDLELVTPDDAEILLRLVTDDLFFTRVQTPYLDRVDRIAQRTSREYPISLEILPDVLQGKKTIMEILLDDRYLKHFKEIIALVDFINRRKLLE